MKIVHLIDYFQPAMGYQETFLAREQLRLGHEVTVVTSDRYAPFSNYAGIMQPLLGERIRTPGRLVEEGIPVWRLPVRFERAYRCWLEGLAQALATLRPDVVHAHNVVKLSTLQAALLKPRLGYRLVVDDHQHPIDLNTRWSGRLFYGAFRLLLAPLFRSRIDTMVAIIDQIAPIIREVYGLKEPPVQVIELGVDTELFRPDETARQTLRAELRLETGDFLIIYTGKVIPSKGVHWLLEALPHCRPQVKVLILGNAPADYCQQLNQVVVTHHLEERVLWRAAMRQIELPGYYAAADVACWPRGISAAMLEAAACALPLVIAFGTLSQRVGYGNGLEYQEGNVAELARRLTQLAQNPAQARQMGARGRQLVEEHHSWAEINRQFLAAYQSEQGVMDDKNC